MHSQQKATDCWARKLLSSLVPRLSANQRLQPPPTVFATPLNCLPNGS